MTTPPHPVGRWHATLRGHLGDQHGWPMIAAAQAVADAAIVALNTHRAAGADPVTSSDPVWSIIASQTFAHLLAHEQAAHPTLVVNQPLPCRLDHDELHAWLSRPDRGETTMAQRLRIDDTFTAANPHIADRPWRLLVEPQVAGVFGVPGHGTEVWQLADSAPISGYLISVAPPHGPELVDGTHTAQALLGRDATGVPAAVNALTTIAQRTNTVLAKHDRLLHAYPAALPVPSCAADPRRIRDWLASPGTDPGLTTQSVADVWEFDATFADGAHNAVNLVERAQQAGVFGIPGHHIALLHVPGDEHAHHDGFLVTIDTPAGSGCARTGYAATRSSPPTSPAGPPPSTASPPSRPRSTPSSPRPQPPTRTTRPRPGPAPPPPRTRHLPRRGRPLLDLARRPAAADPPPTPPGEPAMTATTAPTPVPPAWGWRSPGAGRAAHVGATIEYQGTTAQLCGLFPFVAGSGAPAIGVPIGRHMLWGQVVCLDPLEWLRAGLVSNPGVFVLGQPGAGKSAFVKRLITGLSACGTRILILGDTKPDYTPLVQYLGGQTIHIGRGLDRINPLDTGPLGTALRAMSGERARQLRLEVRGRRMALLLALCSLVRRRPLSNSEEIILGRAIDVATEASTVDPTIPDVLTLIEAGTGELHAAARARTEGEYRRRVDDLIPTLALLCEGSLAGVFDGPTTTPIDLTAPAVSVDISRVTAAGDQLVAAAMLCVWAYGYGLVDARAALTDDGGPRHHHLAVMDELWRALRGAPGLVEHADSLTRLNRAKGIASVMVTHSLADMDALPTDEDRAKAQGFIERSAIKVLAGLPPRELDRVDQVVRLGAAERELVSSWAAPEAWLPGARHPGRGKYLIKTGDRPGLPVSMTLVGDEHALYDTDGATRIAS